LFFLVSIAGKRKPGQGPLPSLKQIISFLRHRRVRYTSSAWPVSRVLTTAHFQLASYCCTAPSLFRLWYGCCVVLFPVLRSVFSSQLRLRLFGLHFSRTHSGQFTWHFHPIPEKPFKAIINLKQLSTRWLCHTLKCIK